MSASIWDPSTPAGSDASTIPFVPTATIAADDVQAAIEETDTENRAISAAIVARTAFNIKSPAYGAVGNGSTDDTTAIQAAVNAAIAARGELEIPPPVAGGFYKITTPITFTAPISIRGHNVFDCTIIGVGFSAGQYLFDFDCLAVNNVEQVRISGFTLRSLDGVPNGLRLKNASYVTVKDLQVYGLVDGIYIDGTRCFSHTYEQITPVSISGSTVKFAAGFTGGGQFTFLGSAFSGNIGVSVPTTAFLDNLAFSGCNWEQCVTSGMNISGTVSGLSVAGCRTEGCNGIDFIISPSGAGEYVGGFSVTGTVFGSSDSGVSNRISLGGGSGKVRGFSITGNTVTHGTDTFSGALVNLNGEGESGIVAGNYLRGTTCVAVNGQRAGVVVFGNENISGALDEWWGTRRIATGTYTATATGMTTSPTGTVKYTVMNGVVTLDIPAISGTSNSTAFTLTGAPAAIFPTADKDVLCRIQDNTGAVTTGLLRIKTTGVFELYASPAGTAFTAAGTKSISTMSVSYTTA